MDKRTENIIEITWIVAVRATINTIEDYDYSDLKELICTTADEFEIKFADTDWCELDYLKEIERFTNKKIALWLWDTLTDVPMNPETEENEEKWNGFPAGTHREEIWHWFEETFNVSVAEDLI